MSSNSAPVDPQSSQWRAVRSVRSKSNQSQIKVRSKVKSKSCKNTAFLQSQIKIARGAGQPQRRRNARGSVVPTPPRMHRHATQTHHSSEEPLEATQRRRKAEGGLYYRPPPQLNAEVDVPNISTQNATPKGAHSAGHPKLNAEGVVTPDKATP